MEGKFNVYTEKIRTRIEEMLKSGINQILNCRGPFTLAIAIDKYDNKFYQFKKEAGII